MLTSIDSYLVIQALVVASGSSGLRAFLPGANITLPLWVAEKNVAPQGEEVEEDPHLPLGSTWQDLDFSLETVLAPWVRLLNNRQGVNLRIWIMRALDRYRFVIG